MVLKPVCVCVSCVPRSPSTLNPRALPCSLLQSAQRPNITSLYLCSSVLLCSSIPCNSPSYLSLPRPCPSPLSSRSFLHLCQPLAIHQQPQINVNQYTNSISGIETAPAPRYRADVSPQGYECWQRCSAGLQPTARAHTLSVLPVLTFTRSASQLQPLNRSMVRH